MIPGSRGQYESRGGHFIGRTQGYRAKELSLAMEAFERATIVTKSLTTAKAWEKPTSSK